MKKLAFFLILYSNFTFTQSAKLDKQEVKVLAQIWGKLGLTEKRRWDFEEDPCSGQGEWQFSVRCDCSFNKNSTCRVTAIYIISENVSTALPVEFTKLLKLEVLDVGQNYLKGTIPSEWATMRLITLTLEDNRLSGPFPTTLTSITSLQYLNIRGNDFSGLIPEHISKLNNLERLYSIFTYNIYVYAFNNPTGKNNRSKLYTFLKFCIK
uniref:Putative leucine-rich repeat domain, L domain-like protein n=1 Tax=Helianthus annuus TaxID=4232 RepID=A0A251VC20_HELAN